MTVNIIIYIYIYSYITIGLLVPTVFKTHYGEKKKLTVTV